MPELPSFERRLFLALLLVAAVPAAAVLAAGTYAVSEMVALSGTAGPWDSVAESGRAVLDRAAEAAPGDTALARTAVEHREALSESVRLSRLYGIVSGRLLGLVPWVALGTLFLIAGLAAWVARRLSRQLSAPVQELVGWTERIAAGAPLPEGAGTDSTLAEIRLLQEALRSMAEELRVGREREIEAARLRSWTEMARRVAHELKNPLTPMRMATVSLRRAGADESPGAATSLEVLEEEIARLDEMARSFAQFGRMPEGPTSAVDLVELLERLLERYPAEIPLRVPEAPPLVEGHPDALQRVFRNLIGNALEAMEESEAAPEVEVEVILEGETVAVSVRDRGPGIPDGKLDAIFDPEVTTKLRGTGLGLALVRQTVQAHGGSVTAGNRTGGGAEFIVRFPAEGPWKS